MSRTKKRSPKKPVNLSASIERLRKEIIASENSPKVRESMYSFFDLALLPGFRERSRAIQKDISEKILEPLCEILSRIHLQQCLKKGEIPTKFDQPCRVFLSRVSETDLIHGNVFWKTYSCVVVYLEKQSMGIVCFRFGKRETQVAKFLLELSKDQPMKKEDALFSQSSAQA